MVIFRAVSASSREEAMELLDEVGNADVAEVFTTKRFMVHFQLKKQVDNIEELVPVDFEEFGEETYDMLRERVYPVYSKASMRVHDELDVDGDAPEQEHNAELQVLNDAVVTERMRNLDSKKRRFSDDADVAELQKELDVSRPMAEQAKRTPPSRDCGNAPLKQEGSMITQSQ
jgi:hypothetical protein